MAKAAKNSAACSDRSPSTKKLPYQSNASTPAAEIISVAGGKNSRQRSLRTVAR